jgi:translocation and assembly module TamB
MAAPSATGRFVGIGVSYLGVLWGDLDWTGTASTVDLRSERLVAVRGPSRVEMNGLQRLGPTGVDDALDLNITLKDWKAADLLKVIATDLDVDTTVSGTLRLQGTRAKPLGNAHLRSGAGKAMGVAYTKADLKLLFEGEDLRVESLTASLGGGTLAVKGVLGEEAGLPSFDGDVDFKEVEIADLGLQAESAAMVGGHITGRATLKGPLERPRVTAHVESRRIFYGDEGMGALTLEVRGAGDGVLHMVALSDSPRFRADVTGSIEAKAPYVSRLDVKLTNARIDPVLRALGSRFENAVVITASANARIEGPLQDPESITAKLRDGKLRVAVPEYAIEAAPGAIIDVEKGEVRIAGLTLQGDGTALNVSGKLAMREDDQNDLSVTGRADLRVLSGFFREWRFRGAATLRSQIGGTPGAIRVSGGLDVEDGSLRLRTFPQGLDALNGRLVFNETQARVASLEGRFGGGRVTVSGQMGFGGAVPASFDFRMVGSSLGLRYPEGLRSTFDGAIRLQGTTQSHWLTGNLVVSKAQWTRKYTITSELLSTQGASTGFTRGAASFNPSPMHLDIAIKAPGTLRLDNNLAELVASADLTLTGSPVEPQLMGRVEIERGKVFFRGNTYELRKGVAHFSNPRQINPVFDIEADTRLRSHRLTLQANGTLDRVSTRITSDPPLTSPQIANLLTGGDENDVANASGTVTDFKTLGTGGVNSFAASVLDDAITGKVAQGVGLSRLSIDPGNKGFLSRTGMRLTVGKRVARNLEVVYSQVFGGTESQLVTAEYSLTNRFSLIASWEDRNGFGADVRTRFVLGRK